jgi:hypothetical protein
MNVDSATYDKARLYPPGDGYSTRVLTPTSIVIHTTNGQRGSSFAAEANFIYRSQDISSHYLIGKDGQIVQFLDAARYVAWHAGVCTPAFTNNRSIGYECHHAIGEAWTNAQRDALAWVVKRDIERFGIEERMIETHRKIALPAGRKVDPSDWADADFYAWRAGLYTASTPQPAPQAPQGRLLTFRVRPRVTASAREDKRRPGPNEPDNVALGGTATYPAGTVLQGYEVRGQTIAGDDRWLWLVSQIGFVHYSSLEASR